MIHQYRFNDLNIVLDINSGSVHVVDDLTYRLIGLMNEMLGDGSITKEAILSKVIAEQEDISKEELIEVYGEIEALIEEGLLFAKDEYEEVLTDFVQRRTVIKAMCLHIAHDCNLACTYCFAHEGEYHGARSMMSFEVGKKAIDFLIENSGNRKNLEIDFFGGEPLMNFDVVKEIVIYANEAGKSRNKNFRFTMTTNGILLDEAKMDFINEHMYNVVLSIDGRKEVNDRMRPAPNGKGSYDIILPKFKEMAKRRGFKNYYVRGTFTRNNLDFAQDVLHLADEGFNMISVEPVVATPDMAYALKTEDLAEIYEQYHWLAEQMIEYKEKGKGFTFFHFMIDLAQGPCVVKRLSGCGAGLEYLAVTPTGELYPCHQFVGLDEYYLGDVEQGIVHPERQDDFRGCHVYAKSACKACWAKFYCSGGCAANSYQFHKDLNQVYEVSCELEKKRLESAIFIKAKEMIEE